MSDATFDRVEFLRDRLDYLQGVIDEYAIAATTLDDPDNVTLENVERHAAACDALLDVALHKGDPVTPSQYETELDFTVRRDALAYAIQFIKDNKPVAVILDEGERERWATSLLDHVLPIANEFYEFLKPR